MIWTQSFVIFEKILKNIYQDNFFRIDHFERDSKFIPLSLNARDMFYMYFHLLKWESILLVPKSRLTVPENADERVCKENCSMIS